MKTKCFFLLLLSLSFSCKREGNSEQPNEASIFSSSFFDNRIPIDSSKINSIKDTILKSAYTKHGYKTIWDSEDYRELLITEIGNCEEDGLRPSDYNYTQLKKVEESFGDLEDSVVIKYDFLLTKTFQKYIQHISKGKLNPYKIYDNYDIVDKKVAVNKILSDCIDNNNFSQAIENCKPKHALFIKMKTALKQLRAMPKEKYGFIDLKEKIKPNTNNKYIPLIKKKLLYWSDMETKDSVFSTLYDTNTQKAVKNFQRRHGLNPDAVLGRSTLDALNFSRDQRIEQVIANMERWRWYKNNFGKSYLLINIPDYKLVALKDGDTTQIQKVVVGRDTRKTPILESKVSNINLNPNWTVPPTILAEDIFPDAIKNRNTFRKKGLTIMDRKKQEVSPYKWRMDEADKYYYVQKPSKNNSLGSMKINFPNKFSVYLHDTNHRDFFVFSYRSLSSGCVRLEKPLEMAEYILNDTLWSLQRIKDTTDIKYYYNIQLKKKKEYNKKIAELLKKNPDMVIPEKKWQSPELKTIVIPVKDPVYIHQLYWTAWEEDGKLIFREDIYCYDHDIYSQIRYK